MMNPLQCLRLRWSGERLAAEYGARALGILTVSDHIRKGQHLSPEERQTSFGSMIDLALAATEHF